MVIKRIDPFSFAKIAGVAYALIGLIMALLVALLGSAIGGGIMGNFGIAAIIIFPILYGVIGFIATAICAVIYNVVAGWVGGVKLDTE